MKYSLLVLTLAASLAACGSDGADKRVADAAVDGGLTLGDVPEKTPTKLSGWNLFADLPNLVPRDGAVAYDMNNPLFTDYANKQRFIYLPKGKKITYVDRGDWKFPVGTILIKSFGTLLDEAKPEKGERHLETRLLIHRSEGWIPEVYVWNDEQTDAVRDVTGATIPVTRHLADGSKESFDYGVPSRAECRKCHGTTPPIDGAQGTRALGPMTGQLNMEHDYGDGPVNQIDYMASLDMFSKAPPPAKDRMTFPGPDDKSVPVAERARGYLQANCAHCHSKKGEVFDKNLWLDWESTDPSEDPYLWGVCKKPTSAGNAECDAMLDIVPGDPDASLMLCRMESKGKGRMAPLGRNLVHTEGVALIREWIAEMDLPSCMVE